MIKTIAIQNYRSLLSICLPLGPLNVITGANGSGKSNIYRALRLLAETAQGRIIQTLAQEGGLPSTLWAGPEKITRSMKIGEGPRDPSMRAEPQRLTLGFATEEFGYNILLGAPGPGASAFPMDPEIKEEYIWAGEVYRPASSLVQRDKAVVKVRDGRGWQMITRHLTPFESLFHQSTHPKTAPDIFYMRETIRNWRFYDHFRSDPDAPARIPHMGTYTPVLSADGHDLASALATIMSIGDDAALAAAIDDAFPGSRLNVYTLSDGRMTVELTQHGLLRPLSASELSDGTLRYLLWVAALMTPRPPLLMVLNEPETSLHPDLLPALARLIINAAQHTQIIVVSHAGRLIHALNQHPDCHSINLIKSLGQTEIDGYGLLDGPLWRWSDGG